VPPHFRAALNEEPHDNADALMSQALASVAPPAAPAAPRPPSSCAQAAFTIPPGRRAASRPLPLLNNRAP